MADTNHTLGTRFAKSLFSAKTETSTNSEHLLPSFKLAHSDFIHSHLLDTYLAELKETLRVHMNDVLHLPFSVQKRSRLVRNYWEIELLVKEMRLLLDPSLLTELQLSYLQQADCEHQVASSP